MTTAPVRCTAPHPDDPRRPCNARLVEEVSEAVALVREDGARAGVVVVKCRRCGTRYRVNLAA